ncbi:MAG: hypothetical protein ABIG66_01130 [Candidatus Kerfeldbacteria bacterium]
MSSKNENGWMDDLKELLVESDRALRYFLVLFNAACSRSDLRRMCGDDKVVRPNCRLFKPDQIELEKIWMRSYTEQGVNPPTGGKRHPDAVVRLMLDEVEPPHGLSGYYALAIMRALEARPEPNTEHDIFHVTPERLGELNCGGHFLCATLEGLDADFQMKCTLISREDRRFLVEIEIYQWDLTQQVATALRVSGWTLDDARVCGRGKKFTFWWEVTAPQLLEHIEEIDGALHVTSDVYYTSLFMLMRANGIPVTGVTPSEDWVI